MDAIEGYWSTIEDTTKAFKDNKVFHVQLKTFAGEAAKVLHNATRTATNAYIFVTDSGRSDSDKLGVSSSYSVFGYSMTKSQ